MIYLVFISAPGTLDDVDGDPTSRDLLGPIDKIMNTINFIYPTSVFFKLHYTVVVINERLPCGRVGNDRTCMQPIYSFQQIIYTDRILEYIFQ